MHGLTKVFSCSTRMVYEGQDDGASDHCGKELNCFIRSEELVRPK